MSEFSNKPNVVSIARSKRKFIYFGILLLIVNFYFVAQYVRLMLDEQSFGYYLFVLALVNLPIFVVSIVLLLVPTMHKHYYCGVSYVFKENALVIPNCVINSSDISAFEDVEFIRGFYRFYIYSLDKCYDLHGICEEDLVKIKEWLEKKKG